MLVLIQIGAYFLFVLFVPFVVGWILVSIDRENILGVVSNLSVWSILVIIWIQIADTHVLIIQV